MFLTKTHILFVIHGININKTCRFLVIREGKQTYISDNAMKRSPDKYSKTSLCRILSEPEAPKSLHNLSHGFQFCRKISNDSPFFLAFQISTDSNDSHLGWRKEGMGIKLLILSLIPWQNRAGKIQTIAIYGLWQFFKLLNKVKVYFVD